MNSGRSARGSRCSVPRIAQVLTSVRSRQRARWTASRGRARTRAQSDSSAELSTCACRPQIWPMVRSICRRGARRSRECRRARKAPTCCQSSCTGASLARVVTPAKTEVRPGGPARPDAIVHGTTPDMAGPGECGMRIADEPGGCTAGRLFEIVWQELVDVLGTAATATILRRSIKRAARCAPPLTELAIVRVDFDYSYTIPKPWLEDGPQPLAEL